MKIVVIGGSGVIGSRLVEKLREAGHDRGPRCRSVGDASAHQPQVLDDPEVVGSSIRKDEA